MYDPALPRVLPLGEVDHPANSYPVFLSVTSLATGSFRAVPPETKTCAPGMLPEVAVFELNVTVLIQAAYKVGLPLAVDAAVYVVDRVVETVVGIQPPNANPDLTIVPTVGSVRVSPNL